MEVFNDLENIKGNEQAAVALGNFDGVHLGHQELIRQTVGLAQEKGVKSAVFTFSNHPRNLIPGNEPVKNILYEDEKRSLIESLGVDYLYEIPFTEEIMKLEAEDFVTEILLARLRMTTAVCGFNYQFGARAFGTSEYLELWGKKYGFDVYEMGPYEVDGNVVSSSLIRTIIEAGYVQKCRAYMGRNYEIAGEVVVGNRLGRKLGFPTSNLLIDDSMVTPPNGVYVTYCDYNGVRYPSITNIGVKPTITKDVAENVVEAGEKSVETHIFDFDKELYGKRIVVEFLRKMRDEQKFGSVEELSAQIVKDCEAARAWFEKNK